jgi:hypothetical protein
MLYFPRENIARLTLLGQVLSREFLIAPGIVDEIDPVLLTAEPVFILRGRVMVPA